MTAHAEKQILRILKDTYVYDMYVRKERTSPSLEFHPSFQILMPELNGRTGGIADVQWLSIDINRAHRSNPKAIEEETTFDLSILDITGKAAVTKVEIYRSGHLQFTDYVLFCRIQGEWRMVGKTFHHHLSSQGDAV